MVATHEMKKTKLESLRNAVEQDYDALVSTCDLTPVPVDVCAAPSGGGTPFYAKDKKSGKACISLPQLEGDIENATAELLGFPPVAFDMHSPEWPTWRTELWHEFIHQFQDQELGSWNPGDGLHGHKEGWEEAIAGVASRLGITVEQLKTII